MTIPATFPVYPLLTACSTLELIFWGFCFLKLLLPKAFCHVRARNMVGLASPKECWYWAWRKPWRRQKLDKLNFLYSETPEIRSQNKAPDLCLWLFFFQCTSHHHALSFYPRSRAALSQGVEQSVPGSASSLRSPFQTTLSSYALPYRGLAETPLYKNKSTLFLGLDSPTY